MAVWNWLKNNWIGVTGGIIALAAIALLFSTGRDEQRSYERQAQADTVYYAKKAEIQYERECQGLTTAAHDECRFKHAQAAREGQHNAADLKAQLVTSAWTKQMGIAAMVGMAVSIFGVGLVFVTFRETRRNADEARRSVEAFIDAERARIAVVRQHHAERDGENPQWLIAINVANFGRSPCKVRTVCWAGLDGVEWHNGFSNVQSAARNVDSVVPSHAESHLLCAINVPMTKPYVGGHVIYDTQFKKGCLTYFLWRIGAREEAVYGPDMAELHEQGGKGWPEDT